MLKDFSRKQFTLEILKMIQNTIVFLVFYCFLGFLYQIELKNLFHVNESQYQVFGLQLADTRSH